MVSSRSSDPNERDQKSAPTTGSSSGPSSGPSREPSAKPSAKPPAKRARKRRIDPLKELEQKTFQLSARLMRLFVAVRERRDPVWRSDHTTPSASEIARRYSAVEQIITGDHAATTEGKISRLLSGDLLPTLPRIKIFSQAMELKDWERAWLEHVLGHHGYEVQIVRELGIESFDANPYLERLENGEMTPEELELVYNDWIQTSVADLKKRHRAEFEAEVRATERAAARNEAAREYQDKRRDFVLEWLASTRAELEAQPEPDVSAGARAILPRLLAELEALLHDDPER